MTALSHRPATRGRHGFTLMEIVVASLAFAVLLAAVYGVYAHAQRLRNNTTARCRQARLWDRAASILQRDLRNALVTGGRLAATLLGEPRGPESRFPGYLKLTTASARLSEGELGGDIQEVEYFVTDQDDTTNRNAGVWVRSVQRQLLAPTREPGPLEPLLEGIESMEVAFYDGQQWVPTWEYEEAGDTLPEAVRVRVHPATEDRRYTGEVAPLEVLVPWPTQPASSSTTNDLDAASDSSSGEGGRQP